MRRVARRRAAVGSALVVLVAGIGAAAAVERGTSGEPASSSPSPTSASTTASTAATIATAPSGPTPRATPTPKPSPTRSATPAPRASTSGPGASTAVPRTVDAVLPAAGVRQWLHCRGSGPATVVVITGLGSPAASWWMVRPSLERITRTCVYDRPGLGHSPARPDASQVVDAGLYAHELAALLSAAGEHGPFVVVGHSFGGLIARAFVHDYRSRVRGLLLAESVTPDDPTTGHYWSEAGHRVDMVASSAATGGGPLLGHLPLLVLSASNPEGDHLGGPTYGQPQSAIDLWRTQQHDDLRLSTDAIQVIAHSGHVLQQDDPPAVVEAVRELVTAAVTGRALRCTSAWRADDAVCQ